MSDISAAPIGSAFRHVHAGLTGEEVLAAVRILVTRETPSSFAVTAGLGGTWDLRLSTSSQTHLSDQLGVTS